MSDPDHFLVIKVLISFVVAGIWIAGATLLAERFGSKIGGLITNLPSNILISLLFIALVNDISFVANVIPGIPLGMTINTIFLVAFIILLERGVKIALFISLLIWVVAAIIAVSLPLYNLIINVIIYVILTVLLFIFIERHKQIPAVEKSDKKYSVSQISIRAIFAGALVALVVVFSKIFNPYIVGILSAFPAVLLSTMVILVINQSTSFAQATGKILILSSSNIVVYGLLVFYTYPRFGLVIGTIISFVGAFAWVWVFLPVINRVVK
jgi:hypothetical protein